MTPQKAHGRRRGDPDAPLNVQEQRQIIGLVNRHPRASLLLAGVLALALLSTGALLGKDMVRGVARVLLRLTGVSLDVASGSAGVGPALAQAELKEALKDAVREQQREQREWMREQLAAAATATDLKLQQMEIRMLDRLAVRTRNGSLAAANGARPLP